MRASTVTIAIESGSISSVKLGRRVVIPREKFLRLFNPDFEWPAALTVSAAALFLG